MIGGWTAQSLVPAARSVLATPMAAQKPVDPRLSTFGVNSTSTIPAATGAASFIPQSSAYAAMLATILGSQRQQSSPADYLRAAGEATLNATRARVAMEPLNIIRQISDPSVGLLTHMAGDPSLSYSPEYGVQYSSDPYHRTSGFYTPASEYQRNLMDRTNFLNALMINTSGHQSDFLRYAGQAASPNVVRSVAQQPPQRQSSGWVSPGLMGQNNTSMGLMSYGV